MKTLIRLACSLLGVLAVASTAAAEVQLTMQGGHVTLVAKNATIRQILAEWERVGQTKVVNADRVQGGALTLELTDMPEQQALDIILRSVSGVVLAPRTDVAAGNVSAFARIILMPPSVAPPPSPVPAPPAAVFGQPSYPQPGFPQPGFPQPTYGQQPFAQQQQQPVPDDADDRPAIAQPRPVFVFPQPQNMNPQGGMPVGAMPQMQPQLAFPQQGPAIAAPAAAFPGAPTSPTPAGVSVPGMMVPAPAPQPGQPVFPQVPARPMP
jgi:hypothetical protein